MAVHPRCDALADPAVARDHHLASRDKDVCRAQDAIDRRLAGSVAVVEEVLGLGLVDRHDREAKCLVGGHGLEPDHPGGRFLCAGEDLLYLRRPLAVEERDKVTAIVHRDLGVRVGDAVEVRVVGIAVLAAAGERRDAVLGNERGGHVILGRERVRGREHDRRPAGFKRAHQVGRLGRDVQARPDAHAIERTLALEALADQAQDGHLALGPLDAADAFVGETEVGHVVGGQDGGVGHLGSISLRLKKRRNGAARSGQGEPRRWMRRSSKRACST
jgi:hypothetical protein